MAYASLFARYANYVLKFENPEFFPLDGDYTFGELELTLLTTAVLMLTFPRPSGNKVLFFFKSKIAIQQ